MIGEEGRPTAEQVLDDTCTITRAAGGTWTRETGLPSGTTPVYDGPCSLLAPKDHRESDGGGDERTRTTRTLLLPVGAGPVKAGDTVHVATCTAPLYAVEDEQRSHRVLQRIQVATTVDAEGVPR